MKNFDDGDRGTQKDIRPWCGCDCQFMIMCSYRNRKFEFLSIVLVSSAYKTRTIARNFEPFLDHGSLIRNSPRRPNFNYFLTRNSDQPRNAEPDCNITTATPSHTVFFHIFSYALVPINDKNLFSIPTHKQSSPIDNHRPTIGDGVVETIAIASPRLSAPLIIAQSSPPPPAEIPIDCRKKRTTSSILNCLHPQLRP